MHENFSLILLQVLGNKLTFEDLKRSFQALISAESL